MLYCAYFINVCGHHLERQLDSISNKFGVAEDQLFEDIECYENHQTNHVFFYPIADYMEKIYCSGFQLYVHLEEQLHLMLPWLFQYLVYLCFLCEWRSLDGRGGGR